MKKEQNFPEEPQQEYICSECGTDVAFEDKICPKCGADLSKIEDVQEIDVSESYEVAEKTKDKLTEKFFLK